MKKITKAKRGDKKVRLTTEKVRELVPTDDMLKAVVGGAGCCPFFSTPTQWGDD